MSTRRRAGFTLIEVMVAVGIITMGAVGILALQQASLRGNLESRQITTATQITRTWIERVRRDALMWNNNAPGGIAPAGYLASLPLALGSSGWIAPARGTPFGTEAAAFDWQGMDDPAGANTRYCVNLRLTWLRLNQAARVEVRTYWWRNRPDPAAAVFQGCGDPVAVTNALADLTSGLRSVQAATIVRWQPLPP